MFNLFSTKKSYNNFFILKTRLLAISNTMKGYIKNSKYCTLILNERVMTKCSFPPYIYQLFTLCEINFIFANSLI
jgi:hypothetical protein